jgi:hypothetical protein
MRWWSEGWSTSRSYWRRCLSGINMNPFTETKIPSCNKPAQMVSRTSKCQGSQGWAWWRLHRDLPRSSNSKWISSSKLGHSNDQSHLSSIQFHRIRYWRLLS